jgi:hypothetical protein
MDDFYADDVHTAALRAIAELAGCTDPDAEPVHTALTLACYAWTHCDPPGQARTGWAMFGNALGAARDELPTPPLALVVYGDLAPLADTGELRSDAAGLVRTVAWMLKASAADPDADPDHARAWTRAARWMHTAAADLTG